MTKEETLLRKRLIELSRIADTRGIVTFSDFLNLNELNILHTTPKESLMSRYGTCGGYDLSERQMAAFLPDALYYDYQYPIRAVEITSLNHRFSEELGHRDYLGAVMNLGIERCKLGDIIVEKDRAFLIVREELADYITEHLTCIRHTPVQAKKLSEFEISYEPEYKEIRGTVTSIRLDTVLALAYPVSRSKMTVYIEGGSVYVNGKMITSNGFRLKEGDIISVRKMGRIRYEGILSETKKGRYMIHIFKYV